LGFFLLESAIVALDSPTLSQAFVTPRDHRALPPPPASDAKPSSTSTHPSAPPHHHPHNEKSVSPFRRRSLDASPYPRGFSHDGVQTRARHSGRLRRRGHNSCSVSRSSDRHLLPLRLLSFHRQLANDFQDGFYHGWRRPRRCPRARLARRARARERQPRRGRLRAAQPQPALLRRSLLSPQPLVQGE
jgi:hypothetical protein